LQRHVSLAELGQLLTGPEPKLSRSIHSSFASTTYSV